MVVRSRQLLTAGNMAGFRVSQVSERTLDDTMPGGLEEGIYCDIVSIIVHESSAKTDSESQDGRDTLLIHILWICW